jgi:hypothetical protein
VIERKMFVKNNSWSFYLDIENPFLKNSIRLAQKKDRLGIDTLEVDYRINEDASLLLSKIEKRIDEYLLANNVQFEKNMKPFWITLVVFTIIAVSMVLISIVN